MKYVEKKYEWRSVLCATTKLTAKAVELLEKLNLEGTEKSVYKGVKTKHPQKVDIKVYSPRDVMAGKDVDVYLDIRNDDRRRIAIMPYGQNHPELKGLPMSIDKVVEFVADHLQVCDDFRQQLKDAADEKN